MRISLSGLNQGELVKKITKLSLIIMILSENGVTPSGVLQLSAEDFDDMGLTKVGKKLFLKTFSEIKV